MSVHLKDNFNFQHSDFATWPFQLSFASFPPTDLLPVCLMLDKNQLHASPCCRHSPKHTNCDENTVRRKVFPVFPVFLGSACDWSPSTASALYIDFFTVHANMLRSDLRLSFVSSTLDWSLRRKYCYTSQVAFVCFFIYICYAKVLPWEKYKKVVLLKTACPM